jgi:hypothetical protein
MDTNKTAAELSEDEIIRLAAKIELRREAQRRAQIAKSRTDRVRRRLAEGEIEIRNAEDLHYLRVNTVRDGRIHDHDTIYIPAPLVPEVLDFLSNKLEEVANG